MKERQRQITNDEKRAVWQAVKGLMGIGPIFSEEDKLRTDDGFDYPKTEQIKRKKGGAK